MEEAPQRNLNEDPTQASQHTSWHFEHLYYSVLPISNHRTNSTMCISNANRNVSTTYIDLHPPTMQKLRAPSWTTLPVSLPSCGSRPYGHRPQTSGDVKVIQISLRDLHPPPPNKSCAVHITVTSQEISHEVYLILSCDAVGQRQHDHLREHYKGESHLFQKLRHVASIHELNIKMFKGCPRFCCQEACPRIKRSTIIP